jgi:hypothetical protein
MKKLLFVVAIATIGLTTSCSKECTSCTVKTAGAGSAGDLNLNSAELCKAAKAGADASGGTQTYNCN